MKGPLAVHLADRNFDVKLHNAIQYSRNLPFTPAWGGRRTYRPNRWVIGRLYFRPRHFSLGGRGRVHRHRRELP